jgi:hypothetical protein
MKYEMKLHAKEFFIIQPSYFILVFQKLRYVYARKPRS